MTEKSVLVNYYYEVGKKSRVENESGSHEGVLEKLMRFLMGWTPATE